MSRRRIVVLSGAGMSAESGLKTFRDADGLWEGHDVMEVATPEGFARNPDLVLEFYNQRRRQLREVSPNKGHLLVASLEEYFHVDIITQNVDDLHERAGSSNVLHLHGELTKARPLDNTEDIVEWHEDIIVGTTNSKGKQLRPHIVWFGEAVPLIEPAANIVAASEIVIVIGTSMQVYPAAGLVSYAPSYAEIYYIDPRPTISFELSRRPRLHIIEKGASEGMKELIQKLMKN